MAPARAGATPGDGELDAARQALLSKIEREEKRLAKRVKAVLGDLAKGRDADAAAEFARLFVAEAARAPRGTKALSVVDWSTGEPVTRELPLDPAKRPREQVEAVFARAKRLTRGAAVATARMEEAKVKLERLARLREAAAAVATLADLGLVCDHAHREDPALLPDLGGIAPPKAGRPRAPKAVGRLPYRAFLSPEGVRVLVGRGASDNDELTLHVAKPHDLWLHAKGQPGAHVVVQLKKGQQPTSDLLLDAAHLAAHFSDGRDEPVVDVTYVAKRYVRKPRGSPPGMVQVDREKVLALRIDMRRLAALLGREEATG
jgi:predicted ribosome quality control (RQC) complex YloA/Tae2 family protein